MRYLWLVLVIMALLGASCQSGLDSKPPDAANATYTIDRQQVTLSNGSARQPVAPGSAAKAITKLSGKQAIGDANGDGKPDVAVVLVHDPGGSGTFYYLAALLNDTTGQAKGTNAQFLGDRIVVEKVSLENGHINVEYLTRKDGEPMVASPSVKVTKKFVVKDGQLSEAK